MKDLFSLKLLISLMMRVRLRIYGRVQGVFFRATAREQAKRLGLTGYVKNEPDGSVTIEAQGPEEKINQFVIWCHNGPPLAEVVRVDIEKNLEPIKEEKNFEIRY